MTSPARGAKSDSDGPGAERGQPQTAVLNIYSRFLLLVGLSEEDRQHLVHHRCLDPSFIEDRFASGTVERVQPALQQLVADGATEEELCQAHLIDDRGRAQSYLVAGAILIAYFNETGEVIQIRAHKHGPTGVQLEIYGRECLAKRPKRIVICEGEFKAAALLSRGIPAIAVPGISSFTGKNFERLLKLLREAGVESARICFDNENKFSTTLPSGAKNERYKPDKSKRYDTPLRALVLADRLAGDGIGAKIALLPDDWRDDTGKVDIDSAFRDGHSLAELRQVLHHAVKPDDFLTAQSEEAKEVIRAKLCVGKPRLTSDGWRLRDGDIDVTVESSGTKRVAVVISMNYRPVFRDRLDIGSSKSRSELVKRLEKKNLGLDGTAMGRMLDTLALGIESGGGEFVQAHDGDPVQIGPQTAIIKPEGIFVVREDEERQVSNFSLRIIEDKTVNDGIEETRLLRCEVLVGGAVLPFDMDGRALGTPSDFAKAIFTGVGTAVNFFGPGAEAIIREVALATSQPVCTKCDQRLGWDADGRYRTPTGCFDANGPVNLNGVEVSLKGQRIAEHLGLSWIDDDKLHELGQHFVEDFLEQHRHAVTYPLTGHIFLAPVQSRIKTVGRPAVMLRGPSGDGKTTLAREAQSCYGAGFQGEQSLETWLSTPNAIQRTGYFFRDAIFVVDDWKNSNLRDYGAAMSILQGYADGVARQRLRRDNRSANSYPIRGLLLLTGEDAPSDQSSVAARILMLEVSGSPNMEAGNRCLKRAHEYNGIMARYVSWLAGKLDKLDVDKRVQKHQRIFAGKLIDTPNRSRLVSNLAQNALGFRLFLKFLADAGIIDKQRMTSMWMEYKSVAIHLFETNAASVGEQRATEIFINTLRDRLAAGECVLTRHPGLRPEHGGRVVGFDDGGEYVDLLIFEAFAAVEEHLFRHGRSIGVGQSTLIKDLHKQGLIVESRQVEHEGHRPRVWGIRRKVLGLPEDDLAGMGYKGFRSPNSGERGK